MDKKQDIQYFGKDLEAMSFARNYHRWIFDELQPYLGKTVAEVGAGVGSFSSLLLQADISNLFAFEPSRNMFPSLEEALSKDDRANAVNDFFDDSVLHHKVDSVLYVNVLEHIEDDSIELEKAYSALNPNGHLLIFVPALPWLYSNLDREVGHFRRYTKPHLLDLTKKAGFSIIKAKYFDVAGIIPWYINFVLFKNSINGSSVEMYDKLVVPAMRVLESMVPPPLGKNVLLVARKPNFAE